MLGIRDRHEPALRVRRDSSPPNRNIADPVVLTSPAIHGGKFRTPPVP